MALKDIFALQSGTKKVFTVVILITISIIAGSWYYYRGINRSFDPRVVQAKKMMKQFKPLLDDSKYDKASALIDDIESLYNKVPGYATSFEMGVIHNNRATIGLTKVEREYLTNQDNIIEKNIAIYLDSARNSFEKSLDIYSGWIEKHGNMDENALKNEITAFFPENDPAFKGYDYKKIIDRRLQELLEAKVETPRRLSVTYSNIGMICRYEKKTVEAETFYKKSLELWPENYVAENNLRVLYGQKIKKRRLVDQMFPQKRVEPQKEISKENLKTE
jgi:tetratricopeptide (TPR) repeat protein